jgi:FlaA1/EpsC-like NDP-sugar epimerase
MNRIDEIKEKLILDEQLEKLIEECAELIVAVQHAKERRPESVIKTVEEMVDVSILLYQMENFFTDKKKWETIRNQKIERLLKRFQYKKEENPW